MYSECHHCRACGKELPTTDILSLGTHQVVDFPLVGESSSRPEVPLILVRCVECSLVQLRHTVAPDTLFSTFWYRSGINQQMRAALSDVVRYALARVSLTSEEAVLDIGCNDGTLLSLYDTSDPPYRVGIDPAALSYDAMSCADAILHEYFNADLVLGIRPDGYAIITAIAMFYDLDQPAVFLADIRRCLTQEGVCIVQMNDLVGMVGHNAVDNIAHEHLCYYTLTSLEKLVARVGLEIVDAETNLVNGGSLRVALVRSDRPSAPWMREGRLRVRDLLLSERASGFWTDAALLAWMHRLSQIRRLLNMELGRTPSPVWLCGASSRGSTLVQWLMADSDFPRGVFHGASERDVHKFGRQTARPHLPIVSEGMARQRAMTFFILPWHFWPTIAQREAQWIEAGGTCLVPLPWPTRITAQGSTPLFKAEILP